MTLRTRNDDTNKQTQIFFSTRIKSNENNKMFHIYMDVCDISINREKNCCYDLSSSFVTPNIFHCSNKCNPLDCDGDDQHKK